MIVGIDIDGVVADSLLAWITELNKYFGQNKRIEDVVSYKFEQVYNVPWDEMDYFFRQYQEILLSNLAPVEHAPRALDLLKEKHELVLITARPEGFRAMTEDWLGRHEIPFDELLMTTYCDKADFCRQAGVDIYIEDSLENAQSIARTGIPVMLYDAPYNQHNDDPRLMRRFNWPEIYRTVYAIDIFKGKPKR